MTAPLTHSNNRVSLICIVFLSIMMSFASGNRLLSSIGRGRQLAAFSFSNVSHNLRTLLFGVRPKHTTGGNSVGLKPRVFSSLGGRTEITRRDAIISAPLLNFRSLPYRSPMLFSSMVTNDSQNSLGEECNGEILPFQKHSHNSIKIIVPSDADTQLKEEKDDPYDTTTFQTKLEATIDTAQKLGKTAIWITIPISKASLMEQASKLQFEFHHAEGNLATLNRWISSDESRIPTYATHQVGVGAVVINSKNDEILCVREKRNNYRPWKIPGGLAELGEDLDEAVIREVFEETGIPTRFLSVLGVRHHHGAQFGRSDLFFVCRLEPIPDEEGNIPQPVAQEGEIEATAWQSLSEYRDMVNSEEHGHPMMQQIMRVVDQGLEQDWEETDIQRMIVSSVVPGRKPSPVYHAPIRTTNETP